MVVMPPLSFRSNTGSFEPSLMPTLSCGRNSSKLVMRKRCHNYWGLVICIMSLNLEPLLCVLVKPHMPSTKAINPRETNHKSLFHNAPTAPIHTLLAMTTALHGMPSARAVVEKVTGKHSAAALVLLANNPLSMMELRKPTNH